MEIYISSRTPPYLDIVDFNWMHQHAFIATTSKLAVLLANAIKEIAVACSCRDFNLPKACDVPAGIDAEF